MVILFVGMAHSVHTAHWIAQLYGLGWDIHLVPVDDQPCHPELRGLTVHAPFRHPELLGRAEQQGVIWPFEGGKSAVRRLLARFPGATLARALRSVRPDIIHVLHMQHAGYQLLDAKRAIQAPVVYSSWGSDVYYFGRLAEHEPRIRSFLKLVDYHVSDCHRDVTLLREYGFTGKSLGVYPVCGGLDFDSAQRLQGAQRPSARRVIALKGYHHDNWAGRALVALKAFELLEHELAGYEIVIFSATDNTRQAAQTLTEKTSLRISVLPQGDNEQVLALLGRARICIALSVTDGTPISLLEAMLMGAFPVQSDTVSTAEWIRDGENGLLVPAEDPARVARAVERALADDALVDAAALSNWQELSRKLGRSKVREEVLADYARVLAGN